MLRVLRDRLVRHEVMVMCPESNLHHSRLLHLVLNTLGRVTFLSLRAEDVSNDRPKANALLFRPLEELIRCLGTKEENDFDNGKIDHENVAMLRPFRFEEGNRVDAVGN